MANAWENVSMIAAESLMIMSDSLIIGPLCATDKTADFLVRPNGYKVGDTVKIKTRPDYEVKEFSAGGNITKQSIRSSVRTMTIEKHFDVSVEIGAKEKALNLEDFSVEVVAPAARRLAEKIDTYIGTKISNAAGMYASDNLFTTAADIALARKAAIIQQLELAGRFCLVDLDLEASLLGQTWFNQSQTRGGDGVGTLREGQMGRVMGMDFFSSINFPSTSGVVLGTGVAQTDNGAGGNTNNQIGATSLTVDALGGVTFKVGDRIQVAGVSRPLIVLTEVTTGATAIPLKYPITEIIPDNAAVTTIGVGQTVGVQGAIFDSQSVGFAMPMLDKPSDKMAAVISDNGYSLRVVTGYDLTTKTEVMSIDCLIGAEAYDHRRITLLAGY